jgi:hypothetical protein
MPNYLDFDRLDAIDPVAFRRTTPYPWANPDNLLTADGYRALLATMPDIALFERRLGEMRRGEQTPHDRYSLEYREGMAISEPWQAFIAELRGDRYRSAIGRLFGGHDPEFRFHWHYTPASCSVSPHCDAKREFGSHIWYFNAEEEWDPTWGGETLVLDDGGRLDLNTAPEFEDFDRVIPCRSTGNTSAILQRSARGWHGVRAISCPEGHMRRVFIIVVNPNSLYWRVRDGLMGKDIQRL